MKILFGFFIICVLLIVTGCKSQKSEETETLTVKNAESSTTVSTMPEFDNDHLVSIYEAQELIKIDHENIDLIKSYCVKGYVKENNLFISMGIAQRIHPKTNQPIPVQTAERAARLDAVRWAGYAQTWLKNNYQPPFGKIQIQASKPAKIISQANVGDSLFVWVVTEVGNW